MHPNKWDVKGLEAQDWEEETCHSNEESFNQAWSIPMKCKFTDHPQKGYRYCIIIPIKKVFFPVEGGVQGNIKLY